MHPSSASLRGSLSLIAAAALAIPALLSGCKTYTSGLTGLEGPKAEASVSFDLAQTLWTNERGTEDGLQKSIDALEKVIAAEPEHQEALILLSRAYYFMADAHKPTTEEKAPLFEKGVTLGERAMSADSAFKAQIEKGEKSADAVTALQKDDQMAIYWTAANLGKWARGQGFSTLVKYKGYVAKLMTHCLALDETSFYGGPVRYWGAFYSVAPSFAGGDMGKSKEMFDKAKSMFPEAFSTYVLYADTYAVKVQDKELFKTLLNYVLNTPADVIPELIPEQEVEKRKAQDFLDRIDDLFAE